MPTASTPHDGPTLHAWAARAADHLRQVAESLVAPTLGARESARAQWRSPTQVHTEHDAAAGEELTRRFLQDFPGHGLVVEDRSPLAADGPFTWHIDPIDGSANHLRGIPYVALTAGLLRDGEPVLGLVHDLLRGVTAVAVVGAGAWSLEPAGRRGLRLSSPPPLADAMAIVHIARRGPLMGREGALARLLWSVRKLRCMGSIALDLALLARGEADVLVAGRGKPQRLLDVLGGLLVLQEAGGVALDATGGPHHEHSRTLIAGAPALCAEVVDVLAEFDMESWTSDQARPPR